MNSRPVEHGGGHRIAIAIENGMAGRVGGRSSVLLNTFFFPVTGIDGAGREHDCSGSRWLFGLPPSPPSVVS
jgi:hypothetical protein